MTFTVKLYDAQDATGETLEVYHSDILTAHPHVGALYLRSYAFILEKGWAVSLLPVYQTHYRVIWAEKDGVCYGGVVYEYHAGIKQGWIVLIFTDDRFRGRHVYSIIQKALEEEVLKLGGTNIASMSHKDNEARLKAGSREGMLPQFYRLYKDLTKK